MWRTKLTTRRNYRLNTHGLRLNWRSSHVLVRSRSGRSSSGTTWEDIFLAELGAWHLEEDRWPAPLTREMFDAWFEVELCASVYDLHPAEPMTQSEVDSLDLAEALEVCAGCGIEVNPEDARFAGFKVAEPERLDPWRGRVLPLSIDDEHTVLCIPRLPTSPETDADDDLLVRVCSSQCERVVRKRVPKALRQLFRRPASDQH